MNDDNFVDPNSTNSNSAPQSPVENAEPAFSAAPTEGVNITGGLGTADGTAPQTPLQPEMQQPGMQAIPVGLENGQVAPKKKANKKLVVGLSVGGGILAVIIIVIAVIFSQMRISSADYTQARAQESKVASALNEAHSSLVDSVSNIALGVTTSDDVDSDIDDIKDTYKDYTNLDNQLSTMKALKDEDVAKAYSAYTAKRESYAKYVKDVEAALPILAGVYEGCGSDNLSDAESATDLATIVEKMNTYISSCQTSLGELSKVKEENLAKYGTDLSSKLSQMKTDVDTLAGLGSETEIATNEDKYNKYEAAIDDINDIIPDLSDIDTDFSDAMQSAFDDALPSAELDDLGNVLAKKAI